MILGNMYNLRDASVSPTEYAVLATLSRTENQSLV